MKQKKLLFFIGLILILRIVISIFFSGVLYPNTNNLIESMLIDLSPYLVFLNGFLIYFLVIAKLEKIVSKYANGFIGLCLVIPLLLDMIIVLLYNKNLIISSYDENLAISIPMYLPSLILSIHNAFNWLNKKSFLGYNAKIFTITVIMVIAAIMIILCLIYLFYLMYKILISKKKLDDFKEKIFIIICTYFLVVINIATINLYLLYFDKNSFNDFILSNNAIEAILDSFYFTFKNFIAIGGNEANSVIAKIIVICTTCINIYFFMIFTPMLLSKNVVSIISNIENGYMVTNCKFNDSKTEMFFMKKTWNEQYKKALFIGINPNFTNGIIEDNGIINILNFLASKDFGTLSVLNLFSIIDIKNTKNKDNYAINFNDYLDVFSDVDLIIIGWGNDNRKYKKQKQSAEKILKMYSEKVYTFVNNKKHVFSNNITGGVILKKYEFVYEII